MSTSSIIEHFSALEDPRQIHKVVYPLREVLLIVLCGTMAGAEDFAQIERWASRMAASRCAGIASPTTSHGSPLTRPAAVSPVNRASRVSP